MLGITFHNPATISVFLDRMRFRDCFISNDELRKGEWERKLKAFVDLPSDGRDRVLFVESFATLQGLVQHGASLESVKVAVYDDCNVLSTVPGANIVDAHINGSSSDTWQLYTVSFAEFNDALASQPVGVPALIRDHDVKQDDDIPEPPRATKQAVDETSDDDEDEAPKRKPKPASALVMEQILDDIEQEDDEDDDESEPQPYQPERLPDEALVALPEPDRGRVVLRKREPGEVQTQAPPEPEPTGPMEVEPATAEQIVAAVGATEEEKELAREILETKPADRKPKLKPEPTDPESEQPKTKKRRKRSKKPEAPQSYKLF